ncbi:hypothetical protein HPB51_010521 [Rhipicephalus microplus]|uniref:Uncharacterized protein n=1 Tax=Rhipicephalus microplus TaxID=6941 RepID=A0A9J6DA39_RHIMP|nr:hypothetical protein HPB51_010521 [Rhipicephalus microplus]
MHADRVKEFGVQDSLQLKLSSNEDEMMTQENEEDENLALLRAFKFMNMSVNIYTVHEAISHLQEIEEEIPYLHKTVAEARQQWTSLPLPMKMTKTLTCICKRSRICLLRK